MSCFWSMVCAGRSVAFIVCSLQLCVNSLGQWTAEFLCRSFDLHPASLCNKMFQQAAPCHFGPVTASVADVRPVKNYTMMQQLSLNATYFPRSVGSFSWKCCLFIHECCWPLVAVSSVNLMAVADSGSRWTPVVIPRLSSTVSRLLMSNRQPIAPTMILVKMHLKKRY